MGCTANANGGAMTTCAQPCRFYEPLAEGGLCRRHAPRAERIWSREIDRNGEVIKVISPNWAFVRPDDWCGEFEAVVPLRSRKVTK